MDNILQYKGWIVLAAFTLLFVFEHIRPATSSGEYTYKRIIKNLLFWPINIGVSLLIILPITYYATQVGLWQRPVWLQGWGSVILDVMLLDLFIFWWHRSIHEIQFFWRFHEVHHLDEHLDTTSAIRFHFGEIFFGSLVRALVIIMCGMPFTSVVIFEVLVLIFTLFHHSNAQFPQKFETVLSKIIVTPSVHWVHHHALRKDTDSNYGTIFSFWDHIFHTKSTTKRSQSMKIGVEGKKDKSFIKLLFRPFRGL